MCKVPSICNLPLLQIHDGSGIFLASESLRRLRLRAASSARKSEASRHKDCNQNPLNYCASCSYRFWHVLAVRTQEKQMLILGEEKSHMQQGIPRQIYSKLVLEVSSTSSHLYYMCITFVIICHICHANCWARACSRAALKSCQSVKLRAACHLAFALVIAAQCPLTQLDDHCQLRVAKSETGRSTDPPKLVSSGNRRSP